MPQPVLLIILHTSRYPCLLLKLNFSMSTEDGASTKRHKAHAMLGQLRQGSGGDDGDSGGTEGWEEVSLLIVVSYATPLLECSRCRRHTAVSI